MKHTKFVLLFAIIGASLVPSSNVAAQTLYSDNFDSGLSGANWISRLSGADASASFAFNYGSLGIPSAPNSVGGTTIGMNFLANQSVGIQQGVSASPVGQSFTGDFRIRFDMWLNYNGRLDGGGNGSTQVGSFGWGTSGASAQWAGSSSSIMFGATGDGGSSFDYRVYRTNGLVSPSVVTGVYAAGNIGDSTANDSRNNTATYYTTRFGGEVAPSAQLTLFPQQTNATPAGAIGFRWRDVVVEKAGSILTWTVDGQLITTIDSTGATLSGNNIFFGQFDINAGSSTDPNDSLITSIYDNIRVEAVPEPSTIALSLLGALGLICLRRKK
ncbi:MAG: PEP-CTERM sorting domain-containing protein [Verrucomicrobiota bacterium]